MSTTHFNCPYCWSEVPLQASVCSHCQRDLLLFKPLAVQLQGLSDEVQQLKTSLALQAQALTSLQSQSMDALALAYAKPPAGDSVPGLTGARSWILLLGMVLLTIAAIALCHWVLLFVYDAPPLFLRLLTITLPALTGYRCARRTGLGWPVQMTAAAGVAALSVVLMLAVTAYFDAVPLWPTNTRDWRETFEYTTAIGLAFFTGYLMHRLLSRWTRNQSNTISLRVLLARDEKGHFKISEITNQVQNLVTAAAPFVSAGTALYSGLKAFTGS